MNFTLRVWRADTSFMGEEKLLDFTFNHGDRYKTQAAWKAKYIEAYAKSWYCCPRKMAIR